jgi:hypothetical protein
MASAVDLKRHGRSAAGGGAWQGWGLNFQFGGWVHAHGWGYCARCHVRYICTTGADILTCAENIIARARLQKLCFAPTRNKIDSFSHPTCAFFSCLNV